MIPLHFNYSIPYLLSSILLLYKQCNVTHSSDFSIHILVLWLIKKRDGICVMGIVKLALHYLPLFTENSQKQIANMINVNGY